MFKAKDFWIGIVVGLILCYVYQNHMKGKGQG